APGGLRDVPPMSAPAARRLDLAELRARLDGRDGGRHGGPPWRSLEELADSPELADCLRREFPADAEAWSDPAGRREFPKLMGASLALAGLAGCTRQPAEAIVPYVQAPDGVGPGQPLFLAT